MTGNSLTCIDLDKMKQPISVRQAGTKQNGTAATAAMTSDPIAFKRSGIWSLNCWINALTFTASRPPVVTIEVSETTDVNSFTPLTNATNVVLNDRHYFDNLDSTWKYFRIVYDPRNATGGTKNFDLIQDV